MGDFNSYFVADGAGPVTLGTTDSLEEAVTNLAGKIGKPGRYVVLKGREEVYSVNWVVDASAPAPLPADDLTPAKK